MIPTLTEIVKAGVWLGEIFSKPALIKKKAWPLEIRANYISSLIAPQRGVISSAIYGYVDLEFRIIPHHVPVYMQTIELRYKGDWFEGEQTVFARRDNITEFGEHELVGTQIILKAMTPSYFAWFEIPIPNDSTVLSIDAVLVIESEGLSCETRLGNLRLKSIFIN